MEVFPINRRVSAPNSRLLHVRGGVSGNDSKHRVSICLLHVRGGVSLVNKEGNKFTRSSPRPWRCFCRVPLAKLAVVVFSTSVEVFLAIARTALTDYCLLHVRGGVSGIRYFACGEYGSSPRPWRCFCSSIYRQYRFRVFSTSVEVFPRGAAPIPGLTCLLHVRGGVSFWKTPEKSYQKSSPRPWRCFFTALDA